MSITLSQSKAAYLTRVAEGLSDLSAEDREEVLQDLEAHLAEIGDDVEAPLGTPEAFIAEFRTSAGLDSGNVVAGSNLFEKGRGVLNRSSSRLAEATRWQAFRPTWIWVRGWLLVSAWSLLYDMEGFERFPVPTIAGSTLTGLILVVGATSLSLWLDRGATAQVARSIGSVAFSVASGWVLAAMLLNPMPTYSHLVEQEAAIEQLTGLEEALVQNIYAYDLEGNPVEVLLFDQEGRPLLSLPAYVYEEAEFDPGRDTFDYENGTVTFPRDQFGRIIRNVYPLDLSVYDEYGRLVPMPPPSLGFPDMETETQTDNGGVPTTTISVGR